MICPVNSLTVKTFGEDGSCDKGIGPPFPVWTCDRNPPYFWRTIPMADIEQG